MAGCKTVFLIFNFPFSAGAYIHAQGLYTPYHHTGYWDLQCITFIKEKLHFLLRDDKIYKTASAHTTMSCSLFDLGDLGYIMLVYF